MRYFFKVILISILAIVLVSFATPISAAFNQQINYQGKLTNASGVAVADGYNCMKFQLWDAASAGASLWSEEWKTDNAHKVQTTSGLFSIMLGSQTSIASVNFNSSAIWLEVSYDPTCSGTYSEVFSPRKQLGTVPAAFEAKQLGGATWASPSAIGSATPATGTFTTFTAGAATVNSLSIGVSGLRYGAIPYSSGGLLSDTGWTGTGADLVLNASGGKIGFAPSPTARLHLPAGTVAAGTAPLKFTSGPLLTTVEPGTIEYLNNSFYLRDNLSSDGTSFLSVANSTTDVKMGSVRSGGVNYPGIWLNQGSPSVSNYAFLYAAGTIFNTPAASTMYFRVGNTNAMAISANRGFAFGSTYYSTNVPLNDFIIEGDLGIGVTAPTAKITIGAGTATAGTAPLKFTSGTNLTTPVAGTMEYDGTSLFFSPSTTRNILAQIAGSTPITATGTMPYFNALGTMSTVAPATSGYVFTSNGANTAPSWKAGGVPYTGATGNVNLGANNLTTTGYGTFGPTTPTNNYAEFGLPYAVGRFHGNGASVDILTSGNIPMYFSNGTYYGYLGWTAGGQFNDGSSNSVYLADGTYAVNATGQSFFSDGYSQIYIGGSNAIYASGYSSYFSDTNGNSTQLGGTYGVNSYGQSYFGYGPTWLYLNDGTYAMNASGIVRATDSYSNVGSLADSGYAVTGTKGSMGSAAGFFADSTNTVNLADGTYAINATGNSYFNGEITASKFNGDVYYPGGHVALNVVARSLGDSSGNTVFDFNSASAPRFPGLGTGILTISSGTISVDNTAYGTGDVKWGGNTNGIRKLIGSNDNYDIGFETNNTERMTVLKTGQVGIGLTSPQGTLSYPYTNTYTLTRTLPTTVGDYVEIGSFALTNGTGNFEMWISIPSGGYSQSKRYFLPASYNGTVGAWQKVSAAATTGAYGGNDSDLEINSSNSVTSFRIRRVAGTTAGTANITLIHQGVDTDVFTKTTGTGAGGSVTTTYAGGKSDNWMTSLLTTDSLVADTNTLYVDKTNHRVGMGTLTPYSRLQVNGSITVLPPGSGNIGGQINLGDANFDNSSFYNQGPGIGAVGPYSAVMGGLAFYYYNGASRQEAMRVDNLGHLGIGTTTPTALVHLKAGTAASGTAPFKFTSGTNLTTAEAGAMEYDGTSLFFSPSTTRNILAQIAGSTPITATGTMPYFNGAGTMSTVVAATSGYVFTSNGVNTAPSWKVGGVAAGSTGYVQYNNGGIFAGTSALQITSAGLLSLIGSTTTDGLAVTGKVYVNGVSSTTASTGAYGSEINMSAGSGYTSMSGNYSASNGGAITFNAGIGGTVAYTTSGGGTIAGNGSNFSFNGASGGGASGSTIYNTAGNGSSFTFIGGNAGIASGTAPNQGAGGSLTFQAGSSTDYTKYGNIIWKARGTEVMRIDNDGGSTDLFGRVGIGIAAPTAMLHLKAGLATAGTAPLKLTSGTNLTTAEAGAIEYNGTSLFFSPSTTRNILAQIAGSTPITATGTMPYFNGAGTMSTVAPATSGYVFTSNGANTAPSWKASSLTGALLLDQTTPQSIINGKPDFVSGTNSNGENGYRFQSVTFPGFYGTLGAASVGSGLDLHLNSFAVTLVNGSSAGYFTNGTNTVTLADSSYAVNATGNSYFNGEITASKFNGDVYYPGGYVVVDTAARSLVDSNNNTVLTFNDYNNAQFNAGLSLGYSSTLYLDYMGSRSGSSISSSASLDGQSGNSLTNWYQVYASDVFASGNLVSPNVYGTTGSGNLSLSDGYSPTTSSIVLGSGLATFTGNIVAPSLAISGGTSSQFLKADGSVDSSTYLTTLSGGLLATGATTGATSQAQTFTNGVKTGKIYPTADSTTAVGIFKADGTTNVVNIDTTNLRVGIGTTSPTNNLSFGTGAARKIWVENGIGGGPGYSLTVAGGSAQTGGAPNMVGGELILQAGVGKGTGASTITFQNGTTGVSGTTAQTMSTKMTILGNGNVGIGATSPNGKLEVWSPYIGTTAPALGVANTGVSFLESTGAYGLIHGVLSSGNSYLQAQRVDGTATAYNILLQPNGGKVGINGAPSYALHVYGNADGGAKGPIAITSVGASNVGAALSIDATPSTGGHSYSFIATGPTAGIGAGYFSFYDATSSKYLMNFDSSQRLTVGPSPLTGASFNVSGAGTSTGKAFGVYDSVAATPKMFIQDNGNMGWSGTPATPIDIWSTDTGTTSTQIRITNNTSTAGARHGIDWYAQNNSKAIARLSASVGAGYVDNSFYVQVGDTSGVLQDRLTINSAGTVTVAQNLSVAGYVGVGGTADANKFSSATHGAASTVMYIGNSTIDVTPPSDIRTKENIVNTQYGLNDLLRLSVVNFNYKKEIVDEGTAQKLHTGMVAQTVETIYPEGVTHRSDGYLAIDYTKMIPLLIKSIQDMQKEIKTGVIIKKNGEVGDGTVMGINDETVQDSLINFGMSLMDGVATFKQAVVSNLTAKTANITQVNIEKMQIVDQKNGDIYCTWIENGEWVKVKGSCEAVADGAGGQTTSTQNAGSQPETLTVETPPSETTTGEIPVIETPSLETPAGETPVVETTDLETTTPEILNISSVASISDINVANGTNLSSVILPITVDATLSDGTTQTVSITWDGGTPPYDPNSTGVYTFSGTLTFLGSTTNTNNLTANVNVAVAEALPAPIVAPTDSPVDVIQDATAGLLNGFWNLIKSILIIPAQKVANANFVKSSTANLLSSVELLQTWATTSFKGLFGI